jgi:hypothetical protein
VKFKSLHEKARLLDSSIDEYIEANGSFVPMRQLQEKVQAVFPDALMVNFGLHKLVFHLRHKSHELVLKVGRAQAVERDHRVYKQMPPSLRHIYLARIFWHTKYSILQEYGVEADVSMESLSKLKAIADEYGLLDITCDNIRSVNGKLKIIDANIAPIGLFPLWKTADTIRDILPPPIRKAIRKIRLLVSVKQK